MSELPKRQKREPSPDITVIGQDKRLKRNEEKTKEGRNSRNFKISNLLGVKPTSPESDYERKMPPKKKTRMRKKKSSESPPDLTLKSPLVDEIVGISVGDDSPPILVPQWSRRVTRVRSDKLRDFPTSTKSPRNQLNEQAKSPKFPKGHLVEQTKSPKTPKSTKSQLNEQPKSPKSLRSPKSPKSNNTRDASPPPISPKSPSSPRETRRASSTPPSNNNRSPSNSPEKQSEGNQKTFISPESSPKTPEKKDSTKETGIFKVPNIPTPGFRTAVIKMTKLPTSSGLKKPPGAKNPPLPRIPGKEVASDVLSYHWLQKDYSFLSSPSENPVFQQLYERKVAMKTKSEEIKKMENQKFVKNTESNSESRPTKGDKGNPNSERPEERIVRIPKDAIGINRKRPILPSESEEDARRSKRLRISKNEKKGEKQKNSEEFKSDPRGIRRAHVSSSENEEDTTRRSMRQKMLKREKHGEKEGLEFENVDPKLKKQTTLLTEKEVALAIDLNKKLINLSHKTGVEEETETKRLAPVIVKRENAKSRVETLNIVKTKALATSQAMQKAQLDQAIIQMRGSNRPGKIKSFRITNLMCWADYGKDKEWHLNANFIFGENGSGKSAMLTAILLGLGAKAKTTGRSSQVIGMIRNNLPYAEIEIDLTNDGILKFEKYGELIGIRRRIIKDGRSWYQVRNPNKTWRRLHRFELDRILATLQIMVDNPLQFLTQDAAKDFLQKTDPKLNYSYYYKGTLLEKCEELINAFKADMEAIAKVLLAKDKFYHEIEQKVGTLQKTYDMILKLEKAKEKIKKLMAEHLWALAITIEKNMKDIEKERNNIEEAQKKATDIQQKFINEKTDHEKSFKLKNKDDTAQQIKITSQIREKKRSEAKPVSEALMKLKSQITSFERQAKSERAKLKKIEDKIAKDKKAEERDFAKERLRIETDRKNFETQLEKYTNKHKQKLEVIDKFKEEIENLERAKIIPEQKMASLTKIKKELEVSLSSLKRNKNNEFDTSMNYLLKRISQMVSEKKFKQKPRGPIFSCISVKDENYMKIVEHILWNPLFDFVVDNLDDMWLLKKLINEIYREGTKERKPNVYKLKFMPRFKLVHKANCSYPTLIDMLDIINDDDVVFNWLIHSKNADQILLFPDTNEATSPSFNPPRSTTCAFTLDFYCISYFPKMKAMEQQIKDKAKFVKLSKVNNEELWRRELKTVELELSKVRVEYNRLMGLYKNMNAQLKSAEGEARNFIFDKIEIQSKLKVLEVAVAKMNPTDMTSYMEEVEEAKETIGKLENDIESSKVRIAEQQVKYVALKLEEKKLEDEIAIMQEQLSRNDEEKYKYKKKLDAILNKIKYCNQEVEKVNKEKKECQDRFEKIKSLYKKSLKEASSKCERINTDRSADLIKQELEDLTEELKKKECEVKRKHTVLNQLQIYMKKVNKIGRDIEIIKLFSATIKPTIKMQEGYFERIKSNYSSTLQNSFKTLIEKRNFVGHFEINDKEKTLTYMVFPDQESMKRAMGNFKHDGTLNKTMLRDYNAGLSGGERSFGTICYLIALYQILENPFFILDEYDVFLDHLNRSTSIEILMEHAKKYTGAQFFFFSPHGINRELPAAEALIVNLPSPKRDEIKLMKKISLIPQQITKK